MQLDLEVADLVKRVHEASRRRNFFLAFSQSPVEFINALIASQVCVLCRPVTSCPVCPQSTADPGPGSLQNDWGIFCQLECLYSCRSTLSRNIAKRSLRMKRCHMPCVRCRQRSFASWATLPTLAIRMRHR